MDKKGQEVKYLQKKDIKEIRAYLKRENLYVFLAIFNFGLNTGLRISDYINLKFEDVEDGIIRIKEKKTKKLKEVPLNDVCLETIMLLKKYYKESNKDLYDSGYLFKSNLRKYNCLNEDYPLTYEGVVYHFRKIQKDLDIQYPIGTHSLRKTWGRSVYYKDKDLALLMSIFNHSHPRITLRYIGIEQTHFDEVFFSTKI